MHRRPAISTSTVAICAAWLTGCFSPGAAELGTTSEQSSSSGPSTGSIAVGATSSDTSGLSSGEATSSTTEVSGEADTTGPNRTATDGTTSNDGVPSTSSESTGSPAVCELVNGDGPEFECSTLAQDCPDGERCSPYATKGSPFDATRCVPIAQEPIPMGAACESSNTDGLSDLCEPGAMCWNNRCRPLCNCVDDGNCADDANTCLTGNGTVLAVCVPTCDPTTAETSCQSALGPSEGCYYSGNPNSFDPKADPAFVCIIDISGKSGGYGTPCDFINACDSGLYCAPEAAVPSCPSGAMACCTPFCDLGEPGTTQSCPGFSQGQECIPFFNPGFGPPGLKHVGLCSIP